jgi:hypothetical protein
MLHFFHAFTTLLFIDAQNHHFQSYYNSIIQSAQNAKERKAVLKEFEKNGFSENELLLLTLRILDAEIENALYTRTVSSRLYFRSKKIRFAAVNEIRAVEVKVLPECLTAEEYQLRQKFIGPLATELYSLIEQLISLNKQTKGRVKTEGEKKQELYIKERTQHLANLLGY